MGHSIIYLNFHSNCQFSPDSYFNSNSKHVTSDIRVSVQSADKTLYVQLETHCYLRSQTGNYGN